MKALKFRKWLEDTGEVKTATVTNDSLGIPSKYVTSPKWTERKFRNPFGKKPKQKSK